MLFDEPGVIGSGGNSGFQALNIAAQFGATRIMLIGFDMHAASGLHWHGPHGRGLINPNTVNFVKWRNRLDAAAPLIRSMGIDVVNVSADSALCNYPKRSIEDAMTRWRL